MAVKQDALDLIGNTPAVDVSQLSPNPDVRLVAKLESANPTGSVKDRIAKAMSSTPRPTAPSVPASGYWSRPRATPASRWP